MRVRLIFCLFMAALSARAAMYQDDFSSAPARRGWRWFGASNLFRWNSTNQNIEVTWDSSQTNSGLYFPLHTALAKSDDFSFSFDLRIDDIRFGSSPGKPTTFPIAVGLINYRSATNGNYYRGTGTSPTYGIRNLAEWDFFPDDGYGATWATTVISTNNRILPAHNFPLELTPAQLYNIRLAYTASNQTLRTFATKGGMPYGLPPDNSLQTLLLNSQPDFRVDAFALLSYSDALQAGPPAEWGSILAHGVIDNVVITIPEPIVGAVTGVKSAQDFRISLSPRTNWIYALERTTDLLNWATVSLLTNPSSPAWLIDKQPPPDQAFYQIRAERP